MYVYVQSEPGLWTVGFYQPDGRWEPESDHESKDKAAERVHYLNGSPPLDEQWSRNSGNGIYKP